MARKNERKDVKKDELPIDWLLRQQEMEKREPASELMKVVATKVPIKGKIKRDFSSEEIKEIEARITKQKINKEKELEEKTEEAIQRRKKIITVKKRAKEMEKGNQSKIIVFPSYSRKSGKLEWYKMGNFSALYYVYRMADRMGRSAKIQKDTDKFSKMEAIASIKGVEKFLELAMKLNEFERYEETLDGFFILYLKKPLTDEELGVLRRTKMIRKEVMHNVLKPKKADAGVYQAILMLDRQILPRTNHMEKGYYVAIGDTMAKNVYELTTTYFRFANGYIDISETRERLLNIIEGLFAGLALLGELEIWGYDAIIAIEENVNILKKKVKEMK